MDTYTSERDTILAWILSIVIVVVIVAILLFLDYKGIIHLFDKASIPCSEYANRLTKDVPARCLSYFSNPH